MRVSQRCYAVIGLGYIPPWTVNAGFVVGARRTLIVDTGANTAAAATIHGYATAVQPANVIVVLNTEKHFDHVGGNSFFRRLGAEIHGHADLHRSPEEFRAERDEFRGSITNQERRRRGEESAFYADTDLANPVIPLSSDTELDLGECRVQILLTPGHTATNLSVFVPEDRVVFCGDCMTSLYLPNLDCGGVPEWNQWLHSLDRLEALAPRAIVCGHGPVIVESEVPQNLERIRSVLLEAIRTGNSPTAEHAIPASGT